MRVLVVDDSVAFRAAIKAALSRESDIEVVGVAPNGRIALAKLEGAKADVVVMDLEMPDLDGIETTREMRRLGIKSRVLIFAAPTEESYQRVNTALQVGADEFLVKPIADTNEGGGESAVERIRSELVPRLRLLSGSQDRAISHSKAAIPVAKVTQAAEHKLLMNFRPDAIVIASSTGGPMALEKLFANMNGKNNRPVFMVQHMPAPFTKSLASRLASISGLDIREADDKEVPRSGRVYVAPADYHMRLEGRRGATVIRVYQGPRINFVIPAADPLFESAAEVYRADLMGFVLTGMGEDGKVGAGAVKRAGGKIMIQDQETSVVWGMPGAVFEAGWYDRMGALEECGAMFRYMCAAP